MLIIAVWYIWQAWQWTYDAGAPLVSLHVPKYSRECANFDLPPIVSQMYKN
jgi:hypothetical protein